MPQIETHSEGCEAKRVIFFKMGEILISLMERGGGREETEGGRKVRGREGENEATADKYHSTP